MKIRQGFVSNSSSSSFVVASSSSSFVVALPKDYKFSEEELVSIRDYIEEYDDYFSYYAEKAEEAGETELLDEREKIQMMLESGKFSEEKEETEPVTDEIKDADIQKGLECLTTTSSFWMGEPGWDTEVPSYYAVLAIFEVLKDKISIGSIDVGPDRGSQILNILSTAFADTEAMKLVKDGVANES